MARMTTLSVKLDGEAHEALAEASAAAGASKSGHAADLIREGLGRPRPAPPSDPGGDHPLLVEVTTMFDSLVGVDVRVQRQACLALARIAVNGGAAGVAALRELRAAAAEIDRLADSPAGPVPVQRERWRA